MASNALPNGTSKATESVELAFPLPNALQTKIHLHVTSQSKSVLVFGTTVDATMPASSLAPLGSFVCAVPDLRSSSEPPVSTALYIQPNTIDFATRLAKALARKAHRPCYVGWSGTFTGMGRGGDVNEEMTAFRTVFENIINLL